jgi:hypothetical protein
MKKLIALFLICFVFSQQISAQSNEYKNAIGVRLGPTTPSISNGLTFKHFLKNNNAIEAIVSFGDGLGIGGLYEIHKPIASIDHLQWYVGFGGYVGFNSSTNNVGAAGIVGLDYKFAEIPLNISLDWKPELNLISKIAFEGAGVGLSARFTF